MATPVLLEGRWYFDAELSKLRELRHVGHVRSVLLVAKCQPHEDLEGLVPAADWSFTLKAREDGFPTLISFGTSRNRADVQLFFHHFLIIFFICHHFLACFRGWQALGQLKPARWSCRVTARGRAKRRWPRAVRDLESGLQKHFDWPLEAPGRHLDACILPSFYLCFTYILGSLEPNGL